MFFSALLFEVMNIILSLPFSFFFFFFNDTATTEIYTSFPTRRSSDLAMSSGVPTVRASRHIGVRIEPRDRKSTRLNSSHANISYAVFCLKKKKKQQSSYSYVKKKNKHKNTTK